MRAILARGLLAVLLLAVTACDFGQYRGDAAHTGTAAETTIGLGNVGQLEQLWSVAVTDGSAPGDVGDPIVAGGKVVVGSGLALRAFDAVSGALRWSHDFADPGAPYTPAVSAPAAENGVVLVGYSNPFTSGGVTGHVARFDLTTGDELPALDDRSSIDLAVTSPVTMTGASDAWFSGGVVCPQAGCKLTGVEGVLASGRTVVALGDTPSTAPPPSAPAVAEGFVFAGGADGLLRGYDATGTYGCSPTGEPDVVQCSEMWSAPVGRVVGTPAAAGGKVVVVTDSSVIGFDILGELGPDRPGVTLGAVTNGTAPAMVGLDVFVGASDGLHAFFPGGCVPACRWQGATGASVATAPTVANGVVYATSTDGHLHAFDADGCGMSTCEPLWSAPTPGVPTSSPVVANGRVYVGTSTGQIVAYGLI